MKVTARYLKVTYQGIVPETVCQGGLTPPQVFITERTRLKYEKLKNEVLKHVPFNDIKLLDAEHVVEKRDIPVQVILNYGYQE